MVAKIGVDTAENEPKKKRFLANIALSSQTIQNVFWGKKERQCLIEILRSEIGAKVCIV